MTKTDAEQHAAVWQRAREILLRKIETREGLEKVVAAQLAAVDLAACMAQAYSNMAESIE